ncbi:MAG TPA: MoaD/ThiS family protein [Thermoguttaceae bacterium]|nr:MoaD/ThiS family protein [Thermoguttaceae bacterium]
MDDRMEVEVRLFAQVREIVGGDRVRLEVGATACIGTLREEMIRKIPVLAAWKHLLLFAVNEEYADDSTPIEPGAAIACFPPVGGG